MGYVLDCENFDEVILRLSESYKVIGPVNFEGKARFSDQDYIGYGEIGKTSDIVVDEKSYMSPKEAVFPTREVLFRFNDEEENVPKLEKKEVILILRACDINAMDRLDTMYLENGNIADYYYNRRRKKVKMFLLECNNSFDSCFCVSMGTNKADEYDLGFKVKDGKVNVEVKSEEFDKYFCNYGKEDYKVNFIEENTASVKIPPVDKVNKSHFDHEIWTEYTSRCIACGRCNTSCPTCSCFTMQDVKFGADKKSGERRRVWASCHIDEYSDMAGGHSFRKKNGEKMRFKTMHKINDYHRRFDKHMCVGCGRCDDVCPEYISFSKCINKLNKIIEEE